MSLTENVLDDPNLAPTLPRPALRPRASGSLFRVVWRWHFYAGVIIAPVLLIVATTGALYIFKPECERWARSHLLYVEPRSETVDPQVRVNNASAAVSASHPGFIPTILQVSAKPDRSSAILFREASARDNPRAHNVRVFVDPYTGRALGTVDSESDFLAKFFETVLAIHRRLFIGTTGRVIVELSTCWTIALLATGLYLWWPRRREKVRGVWVPRLRSKPYTVLRDLHSVAGMYLIPRRQRPGPREQAPLAPRLRRPRRPAGHRGLDVVETSPRREDRVPPPARRPPAVVAPLAHRCPLREGVPGAVEM